jgi:tripartite-type tricarboxylate transporter receptor subunit TctC
VFLTAGLTRIAALASLVFLSLNATAAYPERPIKLLVPYAAGGPTDYLARTFGERLGKVLGQSIVIENKPGGNSIVAVNTLLQAKPDGYTLVFAGLATLVLNPYLYKSLSYNADEDLAPVGVVSTMPLVMLVNKDLPANNVEEFVQYAKKNRGKVTFGTPGNGNPLHLAPLIFAKDSNIEMRSIPYNGTAPALVALLSGQIDTVFDVVQSALPHIQAGKLKALAVTTATRNPALPNVPTLSESGFPGYDAKAWFALAAPGKTPQEVLDALNKATQTVVADPTFAPPLEKLGLMPQPPMDFAHIRTFIDSEKQRWGTVIRDNRITLD